MAREKVFDYPNRKKASSKTTKWVVVLLLIVSVVLMAIVAVGGWGVLQGAKAMLVGYMLIFLLCGFFVARWRSGVLPVIAALAMVLLIFAAIAGPEWYSRDKAGFAESELAPEVLGTVTLLLVPVQLLLMIAAMVGFRQKWQVEVEVDEDDARYDDDRYRQRGGGGAIAAPA